MDEGLFNDLVDSCKEAIEHEKGNIKLKSNTVIIPDEDINSKYEQLTSTDKLKITLLIDEILYSYSKTN